MGVLSVVKNESWLYLWCGAYGLLTMFTFANPDWQRQNSNTLPNASAVADIVMIACLTYLMGGTASGFGILVLPFLATSCLFSYGSYPLLYAGFASSLVILEMFLRYGWAGRTFDSQETPLLVNQIVLIGAYYLVPIVTSFAANHLMRADFSLREHRIAYDRISNLTQIVMNRMQEAAIVVDNSRHIWLFNRKAGHYFPSLKVGQHAAFLHELTTRWQKNPHQDFEITAALNNKIMHIRAIPLLQEETQLLTLFLRSEHERLTEAQTVKLTSLGQLTANLAHEIRNPLSAMRQASGLLSEAEEGNIMAEKLCAIIEKNITRIDKMIEDVSALNKRDRINSEQIDFRAFWENFAHEFELTRPNSEGCLKAQFPIGIKPIIRFDAMHLQQIVWNLCNNGWRHSKKQKGSLTINLRSIDDKHYSLRVWDDGPGVFEENQPHLFEPFFTTQSQSEGTGLGLYVARELAHANKGDLRYLAREKVFELILPKAEHV
ncbi:sensor histidine kinase [Neisseriaceae bacterium B1]